MGTGRIRRIGVLTGGGDCPGLNAVIRAVVKTGIYQYGLEVVGIEDGYLGLIHNRMRLLDAADVSNILTIGGDWGYVQIGGGHRYGKYGYYGYGRHPYGKHGYGGGYGWGSPYRIGNIGVVGGGWGNPVVFAGAGPTMLARRYPPPPPPGWVSPDVLRFLRFRYVMPS
ncbi:hypothetical protein LCGC14_1934060, partial [marine sediment metagenome]